HPAERDRSRTIPRSAQLPARRLQARRSSVQFAKLTPLRYTGFRAVTAARDPRPDSIYHHSRAYPDCGADPCSFDLLAPLSLVCGDHFRVAGAADLARDPGGEQQRLSEVLAADISTVPARDRGWQSGDSLSRSGAVR